MSDTLGWAEQIRSIDLDWLVKVRLDGKVLNRVLTETLDNNLALKLIKALPDNPFLHLKPLAHLTVNFPLHAHGFSYPLASLLHLL